VGGRNGEDAQGNFSTQGRDHCAEDEYILEAAEDAGMRLPYDCRSGTCTTCKQFQLEGEMDQDLAFALDDDEIERGWRLICIGSPLSDCVLDA
jgi:ferredoxin